uniref:Uncharacterized protein n=1 Tax=Vespula pensylvanica TaxID=30213 RepID=A0A834KQ81_VESPE|nr:hypothetical protein H0235_013583 [Vespula pensylvanica]
MECCRLQTAFPTAHLDRIDRARDRYNSAADAAAQQRLPARTYFSFYLFVVDKLCKRDLWKVDNLYKIFLNLCVTARLCFNNPRESDSRDVDEMV